MTASLAPDRLPPLPAHKLGVLVVDDDPIVLIDMAQSLTNVGMIVFEACNAKDALKILSARTDIRVTITDVDMRSGHLDGFQLAREISTLWPDIGLLIISGQCRPKVSDLPEGVRFLEKPCQPHNLVGNIYAFISQQCGSI